MYIKGAIFDMDGTLVNSLMFWESYWIEFGKKYMNSDDFRADPDIDRDVRTMIFHDAVMHIKKFYGLAVEDSEILDFSMRNIENFYKTKATLKDGAIELLRYLKSKGVKMCIASATTRNYIDIVMNAFGLGEFFSDVLSCADIGKGKDQPDIYLLAEKTLGIPKDELCVFEDSYVAIETARAAGFRTVGIFDKYNYDQDRLAASSNIYVSEGMTLDALIPMLEA